MGHEDVMEESQFLIACLQDYEHLLLAGLSVAYPLEAERRRVITGVGAILRRLDTQEENTSGDIRADTSRPDNPTGLTDATGDAGGGDRGIYRGHSEPGADTADWSHEAGGREIPPALGSAEDPSPPHDE